MIKAVIFACSMFISGFTTFSQEEGRFEVSENAKLIATWSGDNLNNVTGNLSNGNRISVITNEVEILVDLIENGKSQTILVTGGSDALESTELKIYEYDFDKNGEKELIIVDSPDFSVSYVKVYNISEDMVELVGNFFGQFYVDLDNNIISLPIGSQGLAEEYIYLGGVFYELHYHDPMMEGEE